MSEHDEVPTTLIGGTEFVQVRIPKQYFDVLRKWASVGRTIDAAMALIQNCPDDFDEQAQYVLDELAALKQPLSACGSACLERHFEVEMDRESDELLRLLEQSGSTKIARSATGVWVEHGQHVHQGVTLRAALRLLRNCVEKEIGR